MKFRKCLLLFSLFIFTNIFSIKAYSYPRGCEVKGFYYDSSYLVLNENGEQTFYLIQNNSDEIIELERYETRNIFMSPRLKISLNSKRWAAFASDIKGLHFNCFRKKGDHTTLINCQGILDICQYPRVKFALSNMGNYWVSVNKSQRRVIKDAIKKGILLRW